MHSVGRSFRLKPVERIHCRSFFGNEVPLFIGCGSFASIGLKPFFETIFLADVWEIGIHES